MEQLPLPLAPASPKPAPVAAPPPRGRKLRREPIWVPIEEYFRVRRERLFRLKDQLDLLGVPTTAISTHTGLLIGGALLHAETATELSFISQREETFGGVRHYDMNALLVRLHQPYRRHDVRMLPNAEKIAAKLAVWAARRGDVRPQEPAAKPGVL